MIDQDQSKYEVIAYRQPQEGDFYFYGVNVQLARGPSNSYLTRAYIVKLRQTAPVPTITPLKVEFAPRPVLVVESWDAEGNNSTNTFYDADLAERLCGRS